MAVGGGFTFQVGKEIQFGHGFVLGVAGMCVGEKRTIITPPELAFGEEGKDDLVPPNTPIEWHVHLLKIIPTEQDF